MIQFDKWDFIRYLVEREGEDGQPYYSPSHVARRMDFLKNRDWDAMIRDNEDCDGDDLMEEILGYLHRTNRLSPELHEAEQSLRRRRREANAPLSAAYEQAVKPFAEKRIAEEKVIERQYCDGLKALLLTAGEAEHDESSRSIIDGESEG